MDHSKIEQFDKSVGFRRPRINITRLLPMHNDYTRALDGEFREYAFNEERAPENKGKWRSEIFQQAPSVPLDLEIGTGNGTHFADLSEKNPDRCFVGIELKYKPLIQSIRRVVQHKGMKNARICRFHAFNVDMLFDDQELNNIYIHFPDPWVTPKKPKNRLVNRRTLSTLFKMQRPGSFIEFKTDSREYFLWALEEIAASPYTLEFQTLDLHRSERASENFVTQFENIFLRQGLQINYALLRKP